MTENETLLLAILDRPDDDALRLVYADWLEEHGEGARAQFIRAQVQVMARRENGVAVGEVAGDSERTELDETIRRLWEQHRVAWFGPALAECDVSVCERGFLQRVTAGGWVTAVRAAGRLRDRWPLGPVTCVEINYAPEEDDEPDDADPRVLGALPGLASWGGLHLYKLNMEEEHRRLLTLLQSPHLTGLREFDSVRSAVGDTGIAALAEAPAGFRLRRLLLDTCGVGEAGVRRLAGDRAFSELRALTLCEQVPEAALAGLLTSSNLAQLDSLFLCSYDALGPVTLEALVTSPSLRGLRSLTLGPVGPMLAGRGAERLAAWPGLAGLRRLSFCHSTGLTEDGLRALAASPLLRDLAELSFYRCGCLPAVLAEVPVPSNLGRLEVDDSDLRTQAARRLRSVLRVRFGDRVVFRGGPVPGDPG